MVVRQPSKLGTWVRFPSPALTPQLYDRNGRLARVLDVSCRRHQPTSRQHFSVCSSVSSDRCASTSGAREQHHKEISRSQSSSRSRCRKPPEKKEGGACAAL